MSDVILAVLLAAAGVFIVAGVHSYSPGVGMIVAGVLLAVWSWLIFGDV